MAQFRLAATIMFILTIVMFYSATPTHAQSADSLVSGETFTIESKILGEKRRINVYLPPAYSKPSS